MFVLVSQGVDKENNLDHTTLRIPIDNNLDRKGVFDGYVKIDLEGFRRENPFLQKEQKVWISKQHSVPRKLLDCSEYSKGIKGKEVMVSFVHVEP